MSSEMVGSEVVGCNDGFLEGIFVGEMEGVEGFTEGGTQPVQSIVPLFSNTSSAKNA